MEIIKIYVDAIIDKNGCFIVGPCQNIAVVFRKDLPDTFMGKKVVNGDLHDLRYLDPKNVVVGLKAKGKAKTDYSGFVMN